MDSSTDTHRHIGLLGATGVGVGAIVGGGILALAGVAFATTGPAAILAFGLNGLIALLTALSFAEMSSKFPESGGTYTFSRKVLSVEAAFIVGWVVWFASIVASVLYALGFAHFTIVMLGDLSVALRGSFPDWLADSRCVPGLAIATTVLLSIGLMLRAASGGNWANIAKVIVFAVLILGGVWAVTRQPAADTQAALRPFFAAGMGGLFQAMGYSFIALQGFDLIAAVGGEVRDPARTIPRAMILSLLIALAIYLPLLLVIITVGTPDDQTISELAAGDPEGIVAVAARNFLGPTGYWLVLIAAVLSMLTALQANLFAASRIAMSMARDRTLPSPLSNLHANRGTPTVAVAVTAVLVSVLVLLLPDVAAAGAASSLIFLMTFAIAHWLSVLVRQRSRQRPPPFRSPFFPAVPVIGGTACVALAVFQGLAVPSAGTITVVWLSVGGVLFLTLFARRARLMDASSVATDPELLTLRGHSPLVLVPIANPHNAEAMIALADTLVPAEVGRVIMHSVIVAPADWRPEQDSAPIEKSQEVLRELLTASLKIGIQAEALTSVASQPMQEIARVARVHRCESVLLGLSAFADQSAAAPLESLLSAIDADVVILRSRKDWKLADAMRILVPVAGRGGHDHLLARLLGSLSRRVKRNVTFLRVMANTTSAGDMRRARRDLARLAHDNLQGRCEKEVIQSDDAVTAIGQRAEQCDLLILGIQRIGPNEKLFGEFTRMIVQRTNCTIIIISRRG